ncbi:MAG: HAD family phosphatase [Opitutaceae bacterium]|nr:HAD family phosphatase [Opitutaceae bacterium]
MQIDFPLELYSGYIFDCDGTLVDSMPTHYKAWKIALETLGFKGDFSEDFFYGLGGAKTTDVVQMLNEQTGSFLDADIFADEKEAVYLDIISEIEPIDEVVCFVQKVAQERPVSVASGGLRHVVERALAVTGLADLFEIIVTPEDVKEGKPAPEMFLLAAEKMKIAADDCLVLEDAELGRQAAVAAGMKCLMIPERRGW